MNTGLGNTTVVGTEASAEVLTSATGIVVCERIFSEGKLHLSYLQVVSK